MLQIYDDGVASVRAASTAISDWTLATPCSDWDAQALAGHLLAIVRYYHRLLDASLSDGPLFDLPRGQALAQMNAAGLASLPSESGPRRIAKFVEEAGHYRRRLETIDWHRTFGSWESVGPLTVAEHTGLAVVEWHVHAWDLAVANGQNYRPLSADVLVRAASVLSGQLPPGDRWIALLHWAGRQPQPSPPT